MNFLEMIGWFLAAKAGDLVVAGRDAVVNLRRLVVAVVLMPVLIIGLGLWLGVRADQTADTIRAEAASATVAIGAVAGTLVFAFLWFRATVLLYVIWFGTTGAHHVVEKIPTLERIDADKVSSWLRSIVAWVCGGFLLAIFLNRIDPLWRHLGQFALLFVCGVFLMMAAEWFDTKWGRIIAVTVVAGLFGLTVLGWLSPTFAGHSDYFARKYLGSGEYSTLMSVKKQEAIEINRQYLMKLLNEQNEIRKNGFERCGGRFCEGDLAKFRRNEAIIKSIEDNTYWEKQTVDAAPAPVAPEVKSKPVRRAGQKAAKPAKPVTSSAWDELDKYQNL